MIRQIAGPAQKKRDGLTLTFVLNGISYPIDLPSPKPPVHLRDLFSEFIAIALDKTAGDQQLLQIPLSLMAGHLQYGTNGLFHCILDKTAGVHHGDPCVFNCGGQFKTP